MALNPPSVSVIIPAYRARLTLPHVLRGLSTQLGVSDEVIVVVTGPDHEPQLRHSYPWLRTIHSARRLSPGQARNLGASAARADLLVFLDADAVPAPGWLEELLRQLSPETEAVAGSIMNGT